MALVERKTIRELRKAAGLTQRGLSIAVDVDQGTISSYERGAKMPSVPTLAKLAEVLGVRMDEIRLVERESAVA